MIASATIFDPTQEKFSVRRMEARDMEAVLAIEHDNFPIKDQCWDREKFIRYQKEHNSTALVAEDTLGVVAGFLIYESCGDQARLVNLAVHLTYRHQWVARVLIKAFRSMVDPGKKTIALVPCSIRHVEPFFKHHQLEVQLVAFKGGARTALRPDAAKS